MNITNLQQPEMYPYMWTMDIDETPWIYVVDRSEKRSILHTHFHSKEQWLYLALPGVVPLTNENYKEVIIKFLKILILQ